MSANTTIEWATKTWNPLRGCSKVSEGCRNCYAIRQAHRFSGPGKPYEGLTKRTAAGVNWTGKIRLVPEVLDEPLKWRNPERVFVNSMSDLFHSEVPDEFIDQVFAVMALAPQHTFQILTKRPERMLRYMNAPDRDEAIGHTAMYLYEKFGGRGDCSLAAGLIHGPGRITNLPGTTDHPKAWPLPNVWLGVSVEDQRAADECIPLLLQTPAAVRFLSCEPLLGPVDLTRIPVYNVGALHNCDALRGYGGWGDFDRWNYRVHWVIVGGESGTGARPMHPDWVRSIRDQCLDAGVPFFFKQWGEWIPASQALTRQLEIGHTVSFRAENNRRVLDEETFFRVGKKAAGRLLDGRTWDEFPNIT